MTKYLCPHYNSCQTDYLETKKPDCIRKYEGRFVCDNTVRVPCAFILQLNLLKEISDKLEPKRD